MGEEMRKNDALAHKLDHLFRTLHPRSRGEYTAEEVVAGIEARGESIVSATELEQFRSGRRNDATAPQLEALATFFGVDSAYFFDPAVVERIDAELEFLRAMRDSRMQIGCIRLSNGRVPPETLRALARIMDELRERGQLADPEGAISPGDFPPR